MTAKQLRQNNYCEFDQINGSHPWQNIADSHVLYPARILKSGRVIYFNFQLAKEMGLIPNQHPHILNKALEKKLLQTFNLRIINEFDQKRGRYSKEQLPHRYMATRYLQLQHDDKKGTTSGDGRAIWNGIVKNRGKVWDISSRGTGVTRLAPGAVKSNKFLKTGSTEHGYGCGLAEIDELIGTAIQSEIFHNQGVKTERILCLIDHGKGLGIGVRAGQNLLRPAHLFRYLKQSKLEPLQQAWHHFKQRQYQNGQWTRDRYTSDVEYALNDLVEFVAYLDRYHIFTWLDWDGDNMLLEGGIIDYGSIRQFGLRHDQYRYDDVERYSTNLNEQKTKGKYIFQVILQMLDYIKTGNKKSLRHWSDSSWLKMYDKLFEKYSLFYFLKQLGLSENQIKACQTFQSKKVKKLFQSYQVLEGLKSKRGKEEVVDGVNTPAMIDGRALLRLFANYAAEGLLDRESLVSHIPDIHARLVSQFAHKEDYKVTPSLEKKYKLFIKHYAHLISGQHLGANRKSSLKKMQARCCRENPEDILTGNGLEFIVQDITKRMRSKTIRASQIQIFMDEIIKWQSEGEQQPQDPKEKPQVAKYVDHLKGLALDHTDDI